MQPRCLCACVSFIICLFIGSGIYSLSFLTFPLDAQLDLRWELRSPLADLSSWTYQNIKPAFSERLRAFISEGKAAFLRVGMISHLFRRLLAVSPVLFVASWQFLVEFSPCESCYFSILARILLKLHILAHVIKSFPTVYGLCSCIREQNSIPLAGKRFERCNFLVLRPVLLKNAYFSSPNRELSKVVRLVELG